MKNADGGCLSTIASEIATNGQIQVGNSYLRDRDSNGNPCNINFVLAEKRLERPHEKGVSMGMGPRKQSLFDVGRESKAIDRKIRSIFAPNLGGREVAHTGRRKLTVFSQATFDYLFSTYGGTPSAPTIFPNIP